MNLSSNKRCTFAIISHPDAGKTTMTEKLLWFGQVVRQAGMVKSKKGNYAKSDWMELEKKRGISVTSSVMTFDYQQRLLHLLDTPGHKDFSEDTYRTLTAVESVLMMIDSAKGVEPQTLKLMEVCRMRDTPIVTFMNKFDREALNPFDLLTDIEKTFSIQCCPMTWPIGSGSEFKGVLDLRSRKIVNFKESNDPFAPNVIDASNLDSPEIAAFVGEEHIEQLKEDVEMIDEMMPEFDEQEFLAGIQTPVFFGSALYNFGVKEVLETIAERCPEPLKKEVKLYPFEKDSDTRMVEPNEKNFSAFVFKIQANMDKNHRDRVAFLRVCSGEFNRGDKVYHVRSGKDVKISAPMMFQSRDRDVTERAYPGDIIGVNGSYQIGDTFSKGEKIQFTGIPSFAPEIFMKVLLKDPLKGKHLEKGLVQLSEEGAVQLFTRPQGNLNILGAVGMLQFDVVKYRLEDEYKVRGDYETLSFKGVRWVKLPKSISEKDFLNQYPMNGLVDRNGQICFAYKTDWDLKMLKDKVPEVELFMNSEYRK